MNPANAQTRRDRPFTLIELLVVIAVIAILMGLLFPAISMVRHNAKVTKAKAEMNGIIIAVRSYESTYGLLPFDGNWENDHTAGTVTPPSRTGDTYDDNYDTLMQILTKVAFTGAAGAPSDGNPRNVVFLDAPAKFATEGYLDPWGNRYVVLLDVVADGTDNPYDNRVTLKRALTTRAKTYEISGANLTILNGSVFAYCLGDPKKSNGAVVSWE